MDTAEKIYKPLTYSGKCIIQMGENHGLEEAIANDLKNECEKYAQSHTNARLGKLEEKVNDRITYIESCPGVNNEGMGRLRESLEEPYN